MKRILITAIIMLAWASAWAGSTTVVVGQGKVVVAANGEIGNKAGANDSSVSPNTYPGNDQALTCCFSASASGDISYIHVVMGYSSGTTGQQYNVAIYSSDGTTLLGDGTLSSEGSGTPVRTSIALDEPVAITSGTTYCLSFGSHNSGDGWSVHYTTQAGQTTYYDSSYTVGNTMPSTVDVSTTKEASSMLRIWATNTSDGS